MFRKSTVWICCAAVLLLTGLLTGAGAEVAITKETFPDDNFHSYIRAHIDQNHDEVLQVLSELHNALHMQNSSDTFHRPEVPL